VNKVDTQIEKLDSLLVNGSLQEIKNFLNDVKLSGTYLDNEVSQLLNSISIIDSLDSLEIERYVNHYRNFKNGFRMDYSGIQAEQAFEKFLNQIQDGNTEEGLIYYYIALYFKTKYIKNIGHQARNNFKIAEEYRQNSDHQKGLEIVRETQLMIAQYSAYEKLLDSLKVYEKLLIKEKNDLKQEKIFWEQKVAVERNLIIGAGGNLLYQPSVSDEYLMIVDAHRYFLGNVDESDLDKIYIQHLNSTFRLGLFIYTNIFLTSKILLGVDLNYNELKYTSSRNSQSFYDRIFFDFKYRCYSSMGYFKYMIRNGAGLRHFTSAGFGYIYIQRGESQAGTYSSYKAGDQLFVFMDYGVVEKTTYQTWLVLLELGMEFIENPRSKWVIGSKIRGQYNFTEIPFIQKYDYALILFLGLLF